MDSASDLIGRAERLRNARTPFDELYQEIAERILPRLALFGRRTQTGQKRTLLMRRYDSTPAMALERYAAAMQSLATPRNQTWHTLRSPIKELRKDVSVMRYFEEVTDILFGLRQRGGFDVAQHEGYTQHGAFGTAPLFVGDAGGRLFYRQVPLHQCYLEEDQFGMINGLHRFYPMTARNAVRAFPVNRLPQHLRDAANRAPETEFEFLTCVVPREERDASRVDAQGMPYAQYTIAIGSKTIVEDIGHRAWPFPTMRYGISFGDVYGHGPAETALPDVRMLDTMSRESLRAAQLRNLPPILAHSQKVLNALTLTPGAVNFGAVDGQGNTLVKPLDLSKDPQLTLEMIDQKRHAVKDAFWNTLFQVLIEAPSMTATEAMIRAQEKGALLSPSATRIESEGLQRTIEIELNIADSHGLLPEMPPALVEAGADWETWFTSPMARARESERGVAILKTWQQLSVLGAADPQAAMRAMRRFNLDESARIIAEVNGYPAEAQYSDDELGALDAKEQQASQMADLLKAAPVAAGAAKDLAQAQALATAPPSAIPQ